MFKIINKVVNKLIPPKPHYSRYYSQDGEDAVLASFYEDKPNYRGFYVDIGAHHPTRFSNTQLFYEKGWCGINIDATPDSMKEFRKIRKRDINIEAGVSEKESELDYYLFEESALNSFDSQLSEQRINNGWTLKKKMRIRTFSLNYLLEKYPPPRIDFMSIDVEGFELLILQSLDFSKYAPDFILVEDLESSGKDIVEYSGSLIYQCLNKMGYNLIAKTQRTVIFRLCL